MGFALLFGSTSAAAAKLSLDRPRDGEFVRDTADLLTPAEAGQVRQRCEQLLADTEVPVFVLTIDTMAGHGGGGMTVASFTQTLFDQWGDSHPLIHKEKWTNGILFVVAAGDRQTRIELGRKWAGAKDAEARQIMDEHIIPAFRAGDYAQGITSGVAALDALARGQALPGRPVPARTYILWAVFAGLAVFTFVSIIRRGGSGWAALFWGGLLVFIGWILDVVTRPLHPRHRGGVSGGWSSGSGGSWDSGGGGFSSGGGGGGGFSGGGGASGSW